MTESTAAPTLGVILFTDLVGSTDLRSSLGDDAADGLRRDHDRLHAEAITAHGGLLVKGLGDGVMATFPGAAEALAAAVAMQRGMARWRRRIEHQLSIRVGVSAGDVVFEDNDCFGAPVVEAARLCAAAEADQILVADVVRLLAGTRHGFVCSAVGALELKGLAQPVTAWEVDWAEPAAPAGTMTLPPGLSTQGQFPFVARRAERESSGRALKTALGGDSRTVLLAGEPGVGKTRLCTEVSRDAQDEGARVLFGRCDEDLGVPYQPFAEALRSFVSNTPDESRAEALGPARGELVRLVPELGSLVADLAEPTSADAEVERACLFEAVAQWLRTTAATQPLVLVLDDLHWAGRPTLQLLRHVVRNCGDAALLLLGTYRDTDLSRTHPLSEALADLRREPRVERLRLTGLDPEAVAAFMEAAAGHDLGGSEVALARLIHDETDGNPFFISEVLTHLGESGAIYQGSDGRWRIRAGELVVPEGVREVVGRRVSRLSEAAEAVLSAAAVIGAHFSPGILGAVCDLPVETVEAGLEEAIDAGLLREVRDPRLSYRFSHALVRSTLYEEVSTARRVRLHRRIGEAIEALHAARIEDHVVELAHHFGEAAASGDVAKAVDYCRRAARRAVAQVAFDEAVTWSTQARELAAIAEPPIAARLVCEIDIDLGDAQRQAGDPAHRETLLDAGRRAAELDAPDLIVRAALLNGRGMYSRYGHVDDERVAALEAALAVVTDEADRARLTARLAGELTFSPDNERVIALVDESLALARRSGAEDALAAAIAQRTGTNWGPETVDERLELSAELVDLAERSGSIDTTMWAAVTRYYPCIESGDVAGAARAVRSLAQLAERTKLPEHLWGVHARQAALLTLAGRLSEAEAAVEKAAEYLRATGAPEAEIIVLEFLLPVLSVQGRAEELVEPAAAAYGAFGKPTWGADTLWAAGRVDEAASLLRQDASLGVNAAVLVHRPWSFMAVWLGLAMPIAATPDFARQLYDLLAPYPGQFSVGPPGNPCAATDHALAACAFAMDDLPSAERHLRGAISLYERMAAPIYTGRSRLMLADLLRRMGRDADAVPVEDDGGAALRSVRLEAVPLSLLDRV